MTGTVAQPSGTVTLVFTDIEGSTRLLREFGEDGYGEVPAGHHRLVRETFARYAGYEVDVQGDSFFYAFASAASAVQAVAEATAALETGPIRIRIGIHTGEPRLAPPRYIGLDVHKAARIMAAAGTRMPGNGFVRVSTLAHRMGRRALAAEALWGLALQAATLGRFESADRLAVAARAVVLPADFDPASAIDLGALGEAFETAAWAPPARTDETETRTIDSAITLANLDP